VVRGPKVCDFQPVHIRHSQQLPEGKTDRRIKALKDQRQQIAVSADRNLLTWMPVQQTPDHRHTAPLGRRIRLAAKESQRWILPCGFDRRHETACRRNAQLPLAQVVYRMDRLAQAFGKGRDRVTGATERAGIDGGDRDRLE